MLGAMRRLAATLLLTAASTFAAPNYHAIGKVEVGGDGGWVNGRAGAGG